MFGEPSMSETMESVGFLLDDFDLICRHAVAKYRTYEPDVLVEHDPRAAAACTYSHMVAAAERQFVSRCPQVQLLDLRGLKVWRVDDVALIRFKKHDEDGYSRNYPTKQARQYDMGEFLPGLPPEAARLSVGYLLDATGTTFIRTQVARPLARRINWCAAIVPQNERREARGYGRR